MLNLNSTQSQSETTATTRIAHYGAVAAQASAHFSPTAASPAPILHGVCSPPSDTGSWGQKDSTSFEQCRTRVQCKCILLLLLRFPYPPTPSPPPHPPLCMLANPAPCCRTRVSPFLFHFVYYLRTINPDFVAIKKFHQAKVDASDGSIFLRPLFLLPASSYCCRGLLLFSFSLSPLSLLSSFSTTLFASRVTYLRYKRFPGEPGGMVGKVQRTIGRELKINLPLSLMQLHSALRAAKREHFLRPFADACHLLFHRSSGSHLKWLPTRPIQF